MPAPLWHRRTTYLCVVAPVWPCCFFIQQSVCFLRHGGPLLKKNWYFLFAIPAPLWHSSAHLLLYCCTAVVPLSYTHCGFMGFWWMFLSAVLRTAVVVVQGGSVDRFMGLSTGSWVTFFWIFPPAKYTGPALAYSSAYHYYYCKGASRRAALAARRFARRLHAMSSAVVVFAI